MSHLHKKTRVLRHPHRRALHRPRNEVPLRPPGPRETVRRITLPIRRSILRTRLIRATLRTPTRGQRPARTPIPGPRLGPTREQPQAQTPGQRLAPTREQRRAVRARLAQVPQAGPQPGRILGRQRALTLGLLLALAKPRREPPQQDMEQTREPAQVRLELQQPQPAVAQVQERVLVRPTLRARILPLRPRSCPMAERRQFAPTVARSNATGAAAFQP